MRLTAAQIQQLRDELLRARSKLQRSMKISDRAARPVTLDQTSVGRLSRMDALQNQGISQGLQAREAARYALVLGALERLEKGTYGRCTGCERPIPFERLLIFPEVLTCTVCSGGA